MLFANEPYTISCFANGATALKQIRADGVDVLLTDKNLPDVGGLDLLRAAREVSPDSQVILITGYASLETALEAFQLGAFDYILKPPRDVHDVLRKVQQAFEKVRMARENKRLMGELHTRNATLEQTLETVRGLQAEVVQGEKLAGIGVLAAGVAHEINSPLFGVLGLAEAIEAETDPDRVRFFAREIVGYAERIRDIVRELCDDARQDALPQATRVDLAATLSAAGVMVERSMGLRPGWLKLQVPDGLLVWGRQTELEQVFVNLMKNAVHAVIQRHGRLEVEVGSPVEVRGQRINDQICLTVDDCGDGVPEEHRMSIFDPFFTTKSPGEGTGLGLNITYRILSRCRAAIQVDASPAGGASFVITFPAVSSEPVRSGEQR